MRMGMVQPGSYSNTGGLHDSVLKFHKTGLQIKDSISVIIQGHNAKIEEFKTDARQICKIREIPFEEVFGAEDTNQVENYTTKAMSNVVAKTAMEALQKDLNELQEMVSAIKYAEGTIKYFERICRNLEPERVFDLSSTELTTFGF